MIIKAGKLSLERMLMIAIVFFIPYTSTRIMGLKISEVLMIGMIIIYVIRKEIVIDYNVFTNKFVVLFMVCITISAFLSFADPIHSMKYGIAAGIYYSFEFGWIIKIVRLLIIWFFYLRLSKNFKRDKKELTAIGNIYIFSNVLIDSYGLFTALGTGGYVIGINRASLMAVEASEAGFINCTAITFCAFFYFFSRKKSYLFSLAILCMGQLLIGSTASIISLSGGIIIAYLVYVKQNNKNLFKKLIRYFCFALLSLAVAYYLINYTQILQKLIYFQHYLTIENSSVAERIATISACIRMFLKRPIFGIGFGNFGWYLKSFNASQYLHFVPGGNFQPNNIYAQILAELGIAGFSIYAIFLICTMKKFKRIHSENLIKYMLIALMIFFLAHGLTLPTIYSFQFWIMLAGIDALPIKEESHANTID